MTSTLCRAAGYVCRQYLPRSASESVADRRSLLEIDNILNAIREFLSRQCPAIRIIDTLAQGGGRRKNGLRGAEANKGFCRPLNTSRRGQASPTLVADGLDAVLSLPEGKPPLGPAERSKVDGLRATLEPSPGPRFRFAYKGDVASGRSQWCHAIHHAASAAPPCLPLIVRNLRPASSSA